MKAGRGGRSATPARSFGSVSLTAESNSLYGGKVSYHEYDQLVTHWKLNGQRGIIPILRAGLGYMVNWTLDKLARDAFLRSPFAMFGNGSATGFDQITSSHTVTTALIDDVNLGMKERLVPYAQTGDGSPGSVFCITSPGVLRDLRYEASNASNANAFIDVVKYADPSRIVRGEQGTYHGVRFIESNLACLYNCGAIKHQATVTQPISPGDGAPDPATTAVDGALYVGQPSKTHTITVDDTSGFSVGDVVTLHRDRTNSRGVTNGVDITDGTLQNLRIVAIPSATTLSFDQPVLYPFTSDLGGGVYAYITKGVHIHTMLFLGDNDGVAMGVLQTPTIKTPPPIDDMQAIYRFSWEARLGYNLFNPRAFEVVYLAGSNRFIGPRYVG